MTDRDGLKGLYSMTVLRTFLFWYYTGIRENLFQRLAVERNFLRATSRFSGV